jgi:hypothetical protein
MMLDLVVWSLAGPIASQLMETAMKYLKQNKPTGKKQSGTADIAHEIKPVFGKYVTRNSRFAEELGHLRNIVRDYASRTGVQRPLNILLAAEPGNGKSFLIKQLAKSVSSGPEVQFEEFHVAAFRTTEDLLGVFQRVQSANLHGKLPFVLFDEVDGKVGGRHILANFLAPMWDGIFHAGKESFALGKAVFCFAASNMIPSPTVENVLGETAGVSKGQVDYTEYSEKWRGLAEKRIAEVSNGNGAIEKCKDFIDRVDVMLCIPPVHPRLLGDDAAKEHVDLACLLVKKHFPQVKRIERAAVVALVNKLAGSSSRRSAERCVFCSRTPDAETFKLTDLPSSDQDKYRDNRDVSALLNSYYDIVVRDSSD